MSTSSPSESWRAIPGLEGEYEASGLGLVRSLDRVIQRGGRLVQWKGRLLCPAKYCYGYLITNIRGRVRFIHQLIALAWVGPRPDSAVVNHKNGIKTDNRPENLEWVTQRDNMLHAYSTGLKLSTGENNGNCKLTDADVVSILESPHAGTTELAKRFCVSPRTIRLIRSGAAWRHIPRVAT